MSGKTPKTIAAFINSIAEAMSIPESKVEDYFEVGEAKDGYFFAVKHKKKWLEIIEFKQMCAMAKGLGGEYLDKEFTWRVPGPLAKKQPESGNALPSEPSEHGTDSKPAYKEPRNEIPKPTDLQHFQMIAIDRISSMPFQSRLAVDQAEIDELAATIKQYGVLEPILVRPKDAGHFEIVGGHRRLEAAKKAGLTQIGAVIRPLSDEDALLCHFIENIQRKDLTEEEKTRFLGELAKRTKWTAQQLAEKLGMSYTWVTKYLPDVFKDKEMAERGKAGGEVKAEEADKSKEEVDKSLATRRVAEEQTAQTIECALCHNSTSMPTHLDGKFYCGSCAEKIVKGPTAPICPVGPEEEDEEEGPTGEVEETAATPKEFDKIPGASVPGPEVIDIGEFTCTECGKLFHIEHVSDDKHRLQLVRKA